MASRLTALRLRMSGLTFQEVGNEMGISRQRVQQLVKPPIKTELLVREQAKYHCYDCGVETLRGLIHHIKTEGNTPAHYNDLDNLVYLCKGCHLSMQRCSEHGSWLWNAEKRKGDTRMTPTNKPRESTASEPATVGSLPVNSRGGDT